MMALNRESRAGGAGEQRSARRIGTPRSDAALEILLVEDCDSDEQLTLLELRRNGFAGSVHVVRDGAEALDFFARCGRYAGREQSNPRLVLLDMRLPKVNGLDVLRQLKGDPASRGVRFIALLSSPDDEHLSGLERVGVDGVLVKPVRFEPLMDLARKLDILGANPSTIRS